MSRRLARRRLARRRRGRRRPERIASIAFILALILPLRLAAEGEDPLFRMADAFIETELRAALVPAASLAIVKNGELAHLAGFGEARPGVPADPDTPFLIGSLSKALTALGIMSLAEEGRISLSARAADAIPGFRPDSGPASSITIEDLLTHSSGFGTRSGRTPLAYAREMGVPALLREASALVPEPVRAFRYSNWNYILLGAAIEAASGRDYASFMRDRVFAPLGMKRTSALRAEAESLGLARGSRAFLGYPLIGETPPYPAATAPAAYIASTARDMGLYLAALQRGGIAADGGRVISRDSLRLMTESHGASRNYGYGWFIRFNGFGHSGDVADFHAQAELRTLASGRWGFALLFAKNDYVATMIDRKASFQYRIGEGLLRILDSGSPPGLGKSGAARTRAIMAAFAILAAALAAFSALELAREIRGSAAHRATIRRDILRLFPHLVLPAAIFLGVPLLAESDWALLRVYVPDVFWILGGLGAAELAMGLARLALRLARKTAEAGP